METIWKNKFILLLLFTGAVYFFLKYISPLVAPLLLAGFVVLLFVPTLDRMRRKIKIPRGLFMSIFLVLFLGLVGILFYLLISKCTVMIPKFINQSDEFQKEIYVLIHKGCDGLENHLGVSTKGMERFLLKNINAWTYQVKTYIVPKVFTESVAYVPCVFSAGACVVVTVISIFLLIKDYDKLRKVVDHQRDGNWILQVFHEVVHYIAVFLRAQLLLMFANFILCGVVLTLAGVKNSLGLALAAGLLDVLPFLGTGFVLLPASLYQLFEGTWRKALIIVILYVGCVLLREFLEPKLIGNRVGIYPVAILLSVYAGVKIFGPFGVIKGPLGLVIIYYSWKAYLEKEKL